MKKIKIIAVLLVFSAFLAGCGKAGDEAAHTSDETVAEVTKEETAASVTTAVETTETAGTSQTQRDLPEWVFDCGSGDYHVPQLTMNSIYANEINQEISAIYESIQNDDHYNSSKYITFLTDDGIASVVFVENGEWDDDIYHVYVININNGNVLTNEQIAQAAGVDDIRTAAMAGAEGWLDVHMPNWRDLIGTDDYRSGLLEDTFSEDRLNDDMMIGLTDDSQIFFVSYLASQGGADCYYEIYDARGNDLIELDSWVN